MSSGVSLEGARAGAFLCCFGTAVPLGGVPMSPAVVTAVSMGGGTVAPVTVTSALPSHLARVGGAGPLPGGPWGGYVTAEPLSGRRSPRCHWGVLGGGGGGTTAHPQRWDPGVRAPPERWGQRWPCRRASGGGGRRSSGGQSGGHRGGPDPRGWSRTPGRGRGTVNQPLGARGLSDPSAGLDIAAAPPLSALGENWGLPPLPAPHPSVREMLVGEGQGERLPPTRKVFCAEGEG